MTLPPEPSTLDLSENRLTRWQLIRRLTERFWKMWQTDYLHHLQQRSKWRTEQSSIEVGHIVLIRDERLPPCKWELGRVTECHPGSDELTRVVTLKTANATYKRPLVKLCRLPIDLDASRETESAVKA